MNLTDKILISLIIFGTSFLLASCRTRVEYIPIEGKTEIIEREKLVPVINPEDSANIVALLECNEEGQVILKNYKTEQGKNLQLQLTIDSLNNMLVQSYKRPDTVYLPGKEIIVTKKEPYPVEVEKEDTFFDKLKKAGTGILLFLTLFVVMVKMLSNAK